jgi:hypothetical protein
MQGGEKVVTFPFPQKQQQPLLQLTLLRKENLNQTHLHASLLECRVRRELGEKKEIEAIKE